MPPESKGSGGTEWKESRARGYWDWGGGTTVRSHLETPVQAGVWGEFGEVHIWLPTYGTLSPACSVSILSLMLMALPLTKHNLPGLRLPICNTGFLHIYILQRTQVQAGSRGGPSFVGDLRAKLGNGLQFPAPLEEARWRPLEGPALSAGGPGSPFSLALLEAAP